MTLCTIEEIENCSCVKPNIMRRYILRRGGNVKNNLLGISAGGTVVQGGSVHDVDDVKNVCVRVCGRGMCKGRCRSGSHGIP